MLAVLGGAVFVVAVLLHTPQHLRGDQQWGNLIAFKHLYPDALSSDMYFGQLYYRGFTPGFFSLQAWVARVTGGDVEDALWLLAWPIGLLYLIGHYALFRHLSGTWQAAALGVLSAIVVRNALGGEIWGFAGLREALPRTIAAGLTPLLLLVFLRLHGRPLFSGYFLLVGLVVNLHPVSGLHLAEISAVAHLWLSRFRLRAWRHVLAGIPLFAVGALPFILRYVSAQEHLTDPALLSTVREALHYRYPYLLFPLQPIALISVAFHAALPAVALLLVARRSETPESFRLLLAFGAAALAVGLGGIALIQATGALLDAPYIDIHQLRATRFMYPVLLASFPLAYAALLRAQSTRTWLLLGTLLVASAIPPGSVIHAVSAERREAVKRAFGTLESPASATRAASAWGPESPGAQQRLWSFAAQHTEPDALVFTDSFAFRYETRRPITGSFKDHIAIAGTEPFYRWYVYMREIEDCRRRRGEACWFALAEKYHSRYAVVDPGLDRAIPRQERWLPIWSDRSWSLWASARAGDGCPSPKPCPPGK